jgi:hypothetical protein
MSQDCIGCVFQHNHTGSYVSSSAVARNEIMAIVVPSISWQIFSSDIFCVRTVLINTGGYPARRCNSIESYDIKIFYHRLGETHYINEFIHLSVWPLTNWLAGDPENEIEVCWRHTESCWKLRTFNRFCWKLKVESSTFNNLLKVESWSTLCWKLDSVRGGANSVRRLLRHDSINMCFIATSES